MRHCTRNRVITPIRSSPVTMRCTALTVLVAFFTVTLGLGHVQFPARQFTVAQRPAVLGRASLPLIRRRVAPSACASDASVPEFLSSSGWPAVERKLDRLPVFTCANEQGQPIQYERDGSPLAPFYADVDDAKNELVSAKKMYPDLNLDLIPIGLGKALALSSQGKAVLVPGAAQLQAAGAPAGAPSIGQKMPLFACLDMCQEGPDGEPVLPLFMCHADAKSAVAEAAAADGDDNLQIACLSLEGAVEQLVTVTDAPAFTFIAPTKSLEHIQQYLGR